MDGTSTLPELGPRGEGWVVIQVVLLGAVAAAGLAGPAWDGSARAVTSLAGVTLLGGGVGLAGAGLWALRSLLTPLPYPRPDGVLIRTGIYARVRHPMYGGIILGSFGWGLLTASPLALVLALAGTAFFHLKSRREEDWLVRRYPDYVAYRLQTRRFIPWVG